MTGLALAYRLVQRDLPVVVFEQSDRLGGLADAFTWSDGTPLDRFYRHLFAGHDHITAVIRELGLEEHLVFAPAYMGFYCAGRVHALNSPLDWLRFPEMSLFGRLRNVAGLARLLLRRDLESLDGESAAALLRRCCGREALRVVWRPLLANKFADRAERVSAAWLGDRLKRRASSRRAPGPESLGYMRGSFTLLADRLAEAIAARGGRVCLSTGVTRILEETDGVRVVDQRGGDWACRHAVLTQPLPQALAVVPDLPEAEKRRWAEVEHMHSICLVLAFDRPLSPYYWVNIGATDLPFTAVIEHTAWMPREWYGGRNVVYLSRYSPGAGDPFWTMPDEEVCASFLRHLGAVFPQACQATVMEWRLFRQACSQTVFPVGFLRSRPAVRTPMPHVSLLNAASFYPHSRCMDTSFLAAERWVREFAP